MNDVFGFMALIAVGFVLFSVYFVAKQIEFVVSAVRLYKDMIAREDRIITILEAIRQQHASNEKLLKDFITHQLEATPNHPPSFFTSETAQGMLSHHQSEPPREKQDATSTSITIKVYRRYGIEENAAVLPGQAVDNKQLPLRVQPHDPVFSSSVDVWQTFACPVCARSYSIQIDSPTLQFHCLACHTGMLVVLTRPKMVTETIVPPPPLPDEFESDLYIASDVSQQAHEPLGSIMQEAIPSDDAPSAFKVVFSGEILPAKNLEDVQQHFMQLYKGKYPLKEIAQKFFSGKSIVLKSQLCYEDAIRFQESLTTRTGGKFRIEPM